MNTDLQALAAYLIQQGEGSVKPMTLEVNGNHLVWNERLECYEHHREPIEDDHAYLERPTLLSVSDIIEWANTCGPSDGEVCLSRRGMTVARTPRRADKHHSRDQVTKPFWAEYLPTQSVMTFVQFRDWFDSLPEVAKRDELEPAFASVSVMDGNEVKVSMTGAVVRFESASKAGVLGAIPRKFTAKIPFGDPDHKVDVTFQLTVGKNMAWSVKHYAADGAYDAYLKWAKAELTAGLPDGWVVLCTP